MERDFPNVKTMERIIKQITDKWDSIKYIKKSSFNNKENNYIKNGQINWIDIIPRKYEWLISTLKYA